MRRETRQPEGFTGNDQRLLDAIRDAVAWVERSASVPLVNANKIKYVYAYGNQSLDLEEFHVHEIRAVRYWTNEADFGFKDPDAIMNSDDYSAPVQVGGSSFGLVPRTAWPTGATGGSGRGVVLQIEMSRQASELAAGFPAYQRAVVVKARQFFNGGDSVPSSDRRAVADILAPFDVPPIGV